MAHPWRSLHPLLIASRLATVATLFCLLGMKRRAADNAEGAKHRKAASYDILCPLPPYSSTSGVHDHAWSARGVGGTVGTFIL